eukprot:scaffold17885_cov38-Tisochrysis_lutea.AAC.1
MRVKTQKPMAMGTTVAVADAAVDKRTAAAAKAAFSKLDSVSLPSSLPGGAKSRFAGNGYAAVLAATTFAVWRSRQAAGVEMACPNVGGTPVLTASASVGKMLRVKRAVSTISMGRPKAEETCRRCATRRESGMVFVPAPCKTAGFMHTRSPAASGS